MLRKVSSNKTGIQKHTESRSNVVHPDLVTRTVDAFHCYRRLPWSPTCPRVVDLWRLGPSPSSLIRCALLSVVADQQLCLPPHSMGVSGVWALVRLSAACRVALATPACGHWLYQTRNPHGPHLIIDALHMGLTGGDTLDTVEGTVTKTSRCVPNDDCLFGSPQGGDFPVQGSNDRNLW